MDLIIYHKKTKEVIAVIENLEDTANSLLLKTQFAANVVDSYEEETYSNKNGIMIYGKKKDKGKIIYLSDYIKPY